MQEYIGQARDQPTIKICSLLYNCLSSCTEVLSKKQYTNPCIRQHVLSKKMESIILAIQSGV